MKQRQHIFQSWVIEVVTVLLASTISFPVSDTLGVQLSILPFIMVACYVALKFIYHLCLSLSAHIISLPSLFRHKPTQSDRLTKDDCNLATAISMVGNDDIQMKRMELFHYEYQHEERQYLQQKEREEDESEEQDSTLASKATVDFQALRKINSDIIAWIRIPDTKIDYPIVQGKNNAYYLKHMFQKTEHAAGSIFLDVDNEADFSNRFIWNICLCICLRHGFYIINVFYCFCR